MDIEQTLFEYPITLDGHEATLASAIGDWLWRRTHHNDEGALEGEKQSTARELFDDKRRGTKNRNNLGKSEKQQNELRKN